MQYILTEEEYNKLHKTFKADLNKKQNIINNLCRRVCDNEPIIIDWVDKNKPQIHGCIHSEDSLGYCDDCSVQDYCGLIKEYSK